MATLNSGGGRFVKGGSQHAGTHWDALGRTGLHWKALESTGRMLGGAGRALREARCAMEDRGRSWEIVGERGRWLR